MKVKDLIKLLEQVDPELDVYARHQSNGTFSGCFTTVRYSDRIGGIAIEGHYREDSKEVKDYGKYKGRSTGI